MGTTKMARPSCSGFVIFLVVQLVVVSPFLAHAKDNYTDCTPLPLNTPYHTDEVLWVQNANPDIIEAPVSPILRGPNQTPEVGYNTRYGVKCPLSGPINYLYWTETPASPTNLPGGSFIYNKSVMIPSSNTTLEPFTNKIIPVEELLAGDLKKPVVSETCDAEGRCIEAFELVATEVTLDVGFRGPDGKPLLSQFLAYDGSVPGPRFEVKQGVQTLIRMHNQVYCNTTTWQPENTTCSFYQLIDALSLHHHGASAIAPFDGWSPDRVPTCKWKDYVFPNEKGMAANSYHDHSLGTSSITLGSGLFGSYYIKPCNLETIPLPLRALQPDGNPQQLMIYDLFFWQVPGSRYMNPYMANTQSAFNTTEQPLIAAVAADHMFVNGKPWPQVSVQRKPYWFVLQNAAQTRTLALLLMNNRTNATLPVWFVGAEGGMRTEPYLQKEMFLMGAGEKYHVVIDFSQASPGDAFVLNNLPTLEANFAQFCYTNLVIKFIVDGTQPAAAPFNPNYTAPNPDAKDIKETCDLALKRGPDLETVASLEITAPHTTEPTVQGWGFLSLNYSSTKPLPGQWAVALMPANNWSLFSTTPLPIPPAFEMRRRASRRAMLRAADPAAADPAADAAVAAAQAAHGRLLKQAEPFILDTVPYSLAQNSWASWTFKNQGGGTHPHPIHVHVVEFYLCPSNTTLFPKTFALDVPRDTFYLDSGDTTTVVARAGPHQGQFQFHCHNLFHEDAGLMGEYNITSFTKPPINTSFNNFTHKSADNYGMGTRASDPYGANYQYTDPLVESVPEYPFVAHNMFYPYSMPYWAYRTDPKDPGRPQKLTKALMKKVLRRNYYAVYYPRGRTSLEEPWPKNKQYITVPPAPTAPSTHI